MNLHKNINEQLVAIDKLFADCPNQLLITFVEGIVIIRIDDRDAASYYGAKVNKAGWDCILIKNSFCDRYILQVYLHRP